MADMIQVYLNRSGAAVPGLIKDLKNKVPNRGEVLDAAEAVILNRIRTRFRKAQYPDGSPWPISAAYEKRRAGGYTKSNGRRVTGGNTLFATGTLFHSLFAYRKGAVDGPRAITFDQRRAPYGADHQLGEGGQIERTFIGFGPDDGSVVEAVLIRKFGGPL